MKKKKTIRKRFYNLLRAALSVCVCVAIAFAPIEETQPPAVYALDQTQTKEDASKLTLHAKAAVLMDADNGRILYEKEGNTSLAMASTTKIMTCILALEFANTNDLVTVSARASSMPKVRLGMVEDEQFVMEDLLYSLMLESHNDSAVAIAEHVAGSMEAFADLMNQKARDIGCYDTFFITPNGLDAAVTGEDGTQRTHHTTAADLARILRYCIQTSPAREQFLTITRAKTHTFSNHKQTRQFACRNHNALLEMMDGALTGKTGFTAKAGYCYVGAVRTDGKTFIVALLACGWPNHKTYKWADMRTLVQYGDKQYSYRDLYEECPLPHLTVRQPTGEETIGLSMDTSGGSELRTLVKEGEHAKMEVEIPKSLDAPVTEGEVVGYVRYLLGDYVLKEFPVVAEQTVLRKGFGWCLRELLREYVGSG